MLCRARLSIVGSSLELVVGSLLKGKGLTSNGGLLQTDGVGRSDVIG